MALELNFVSALMLFHNEQLSSMQISRSTTPLQLQTCEV